MSSPLVITIDGPAASGKTTVSRLLAKKYHWSWVSTGAFYRGLAYIAQHEDISLDDEQALADLCVANIWSVEMTAEKTKVILRNKDVTDEIYDEEVGSAASRISRYPMVRANLLQSQRNCAIKVVGLVAEGRDCGTVVFPEAQVKFFITAKSDSRAERRAREKGKNVDEMRAAQVIRDTQDSSRVAAPMQAPPGAHVIDTSEMELPQVVDVIDQIIRKELEI